MERSNSSIDDNSNKDSDDSKKNGILLEISEDLQNENIVSEIKYLPLQEDLKITFSEVYRNHVLHIPGDIKGTSKWIKKLEARVKRRIPVVDGNHYLLIENVIHNNLGLLQKISDDNFSSIKEQERQKDKLKDDPASSFHDIFGVSLPDIDSQGTNNIASSNIIDKNIIDKHEPRSKINGSDYIEYAIKIINKTGYFCQRCADDLIQSELAVKIERNGLI
jgi:hypothetical protein